jgi:hypothetical protein
MRSKETTAATDLGVMLGAEFKRLKLKTLKLKTSPGASLRGSHPLKTEKGGAPPVVVGTGNERVGHPSNGVATGFFHNHPPKWTLGGKDA